MTKCCGGCTANVNRDMRNAPKRLRKTDLDAIKYITINPSPLIHLHLFIIRLYIQALELYLSSPGES